MLHFLTPAKKGGDAEERRSKPVSGNWAMSVIRGSYLVPVGVSARSSYRVLFLTVPTQKILYVSHSWEVPADRGVGVSAPHM